MRSQQTAIELCILIPCYNNEDGLIESINSIHFHPERLKIIIVDDGSSPHITPDGLRHRINEKFTIEILRLRCNKGITNALNKGLQYIFSTCITRYIARLDCGDLCSPERFYKQAGFLNANPSVQLLGSWCYFRNPVSGSAYAFTTPTGHRQIERSMYFRNVFVHPTVMWRVSALNRQYYPDKYPYAEDYGLFYHMVTASESAILNEFLVTCEINPRGITMQNRRSQLKSRAKVIQDYGSNQLLVFLGKVKLLVLLVLPYRLVHLLKLQLFKI